MNNKTKWRIYSKRYRLLHKIKRKQTTQYRKNYYILNKDPYSKIKIKDIDFIELIKIIQNGW